MDWWSTHRNGTPSGGVYRIFLLFSHGEIMTNQKREEISNELTRLLAEQTNFLGKVKPTPSEREEFQRSLDRVRELFAELARSKAA
jgi:hypothetical protein